MTEQAPEDRRDQAGGEQKVPLDAPGLVQWCVGLLAAAAWQAMGLIPNPATNKLERNLPDARLAIDATAALVEVLRPRLDDKQRRELDTLLTDLRVNFVEQQAREQR